MKKVCHLSSGHTINDIRIFEKECTSLASHGYNITYIACGNTYFEDCKNGVKRILLDVPVKNRLQRMIKRPKMIYKKAIELNADIYHFHDSELLPVGLKLKKQGKYVIFDSHEFYFEQIQERTYLPKILRKISAYIYKKYETYVCKRIDAVIQVCTLEGKNYFKNRTKKNIFIANTPFLKNLSSNYSTHFEKRKSIIYLGSLSPERGISTLVKVATITKTKLILAGNFTSEEYKNEVLSSLDSKYVNYVGYLNKKSVNEFLNKCFAGISVLRNIGQYSKIDTLPTKVYDYMALGIPVVISGTPYAKKMINKYNFGICVDPDNVRDIAYAIKYLKENPEQAHKMGMNGRKAVFEVFNWSVEEKKLLSLYNSLED